MNEFLSPKMLEALEFAAVAHKDQLRKHPHGHPYVCHVFAVGLILFKAVFDEDVVIAGILHDVIEDTKFTAKDIEEKFGKKVLGLVLDVTQDETLPTLEKKEKYVEHLKVVSNEAKAISAADLLANRMDCLNVLKLGQNPWVSFDRTPQQFFTTDAKRMEIIKSSTNLPYMDQLEAVEKEVIELTHKLGFYA